MTAAEREELAGVLVDVLMGTAGDFGLSRGLRLRELIELAKHDARFPGAFLRRWLLTDSRARAIVKTELERRL